MCALHYRAHHVNYLDFTITINLNSRYSPLKNGYRAVKHSKTDLYRLKPSYPFSDTLSPCKDREP